MDQSATRSRRRSKSHLPKHSSLAELQLIPRSCCGQCGTGSSSTLISFCLWCTWASQESKHLSTPRARRMSAPARMRLQGDSSSAPHRRRSLVRRSSLKKRRTPGFPENALHDAEFVVPRKSDSRSSAFEVETTNDLDISIRGAEAQEAKNRHVGPAVLQPAVPRVVLDEEESDPRFTSEKITIATSSSLSSSPEGKQGLQVGVDSGSIPSSTNTDLDNLAPLPGDRSAERPKSGLMTINKATRKLKSSRRLLFVDFHDTKAPLSSDDNAHDGDINASNNSPSPVKSDLAARPHQLPTLRRKKHLNVQTSVPDADIPEPIAISLTLRASPSKGILRKASHPQFPSPPAINTSRLNPRPLSHIISLDSESDDAATTASPLKPILSLSTAPAVLSSSPSKPSSSPVRLGHPSRPYYSAIRAHGISPPPTRPPSVIGSPPVRSRPQSTPPAASHQSSSTATSTSTPASRHLSLSFSPAYAPTSSAGVFSAFSVLEDPLDEDDHHLPALPPSPAPARLSFSIAGRSTSIGRARGQRLSLGAPTSASSEHARAQSLSHARAKGYRGSGGVGFSMSGETELRMALATGAASAGRAEDGFRFRETSVSPPASAGIVATGVGRRKRSKTVDQMDETARSGFMDRVRKLRKGLKEMLS